jgi:acyl-CoA synthetase (AMP-forming)/AMP-acid ligase II/NAD(P)-dependent dehydrogenase (short-subunit alcohol dehydrogenase family)
MSQTVASRPSGPYRCAAVAAEERERGRLVRAAESLRDRRRVDEAELRIAIAGKRVLITGASYGLGEATARRLAGAGATVLLTARSGARLEEIVAEIQASGGSAHSHVADLTDVASIEALAAWVLEAHPPVDVVVSNAGKSIRRSVGLSYDRFHDFERTIGVNYLGPVRLLLALLPSMRARGEGQVISVSTAGVRLPPAPRWGAYQASKGAFDTWLRSAAPELRSDGVIATSVYMGLIHTRMSAPNYRHLPGDTPEQAAERVCRAIVRRPRSLAPWWIPPAEVAGAATRNLIDAGFSLSFPYTRDSAAAQGAAAAAAPAAGESERLFHVRLGRRAFRALRGAGVFAPVPPARLPAFGRAMRIGKGPGMLVAMTAAREPARIAIADERGEISYSELDRRGGAIATGLRDDYGVGAGALVAVMCRNHRGCIEALVAATRLGADLLLLNTDFPAPQLAKIVERERPAVLIHDEEFTARLADSGFEGPRVLAWQEGQAEGASLDALGERPAAKLAAPAREGRLVVLTSGTTGVPKSAPRDPDPVAMLVPVTAVLSNIPLRSGDPILLAPPLFHGFGLATLSLSLLLGSTIVLRRRFEAEAALAAIAKYRVRALAGVPVMLDRIVRCPAEVRSSHDTSSLRAIITGGSALSPATSAAVTEAFGDVLYNVYGSSEAGFAAIARPADLRAAPGTVGFAPWGTTLKVLDAERREAAVGEVGHIFVGSRLVFDGYGSDDDAKEMVGGLINTGDLGHRDEAGRLLIDGREDTMIVSGGENVFPEEVVEVLGRHEAIDDVAVVGVEDEDFGQRLRAYVVPAAGAAPTPEELRLHVKEHLPRFQVPREFVFVAEIPRTATGKIRVQALDAAP